MLQTIVPGLTFKENLDRLPSIEGLARIDLTDASGAAVTSIENQPGKQGSLAVYHYLGLAFGSIDEQAARHGLEVFGEHTADALSRPGAHPNIDRLLEIINGAAPLQVSAIRQ